MMRSRIFPWLASLLLLLPAMSAAQPAQVSLDPAQTKIAWTLPATGHEVHGTFRLKSGTMRFDPNTGQAGGAIVVDATSAQSGNSRRDKKMHKDVLESATYPEITFFPKHVNGRLVENGTSNLQVEGVFRIHGADHEITLLLAVRKNGPDVSADTSLVVPYQEWGMRDPGNFFLHVDKKVPVSISTVGRITSPGR
jgi:polyisoprenoid-binding protein YceI